MKNKSITIIISAILVLTMVGVVFWFVKNKGEDNKEASQKEIFIQESNQDQKESSMEEIDTNNWKNYRNEKYGFEFKYPLSKNVYKFSDSGESYVLATGNDSNSYVGDVSGDKFIFSISSTIGKTDLTESFVEDRFGENGNVYDMKILPFEINNLKGLTVYFGKNDGSIVSNFYFIQNQDGRIFDITVALNNNEADKIFSSLKLVD